jgi:hypothetical protein
MSERFSFEVTFQCSEAEDDQNQGCMVDGQGVHMENSLGTAL